MLPSWRQTFLLTEPAAGDLLGRSNRSRRWLGSQVWLDECRTRIQASGGPGPWILGLDRHRRPARKRRDLDSMEEAGVHRGSRAGDPRTDRTGDGDRGEDGDERHARDDPEVSHVWGDPTTESRVSWGFDAIRDQIATLSASRSMPTRTYPVDGPLDLAPDARARCRAGPGDPTIRLAPGTGRPGDPDDRRAGRDRRSSTPATSSASRPGGPGAERALADVPALLGLDREPAADPGRPPARRPAGPQLARASGSRARGAVLESLVPAILEQKVTGQEARRAWLGLIRAHGEPAPGPAEWRLRARPAAGDPRRAPLLRVPPVRGRAPARRPDPAGRRAERPGSRRSWTCRSPRPTPG